MYKSVNIIYYSEVRGSKVVFYWRLSLDIEQIVWVAYCRI